MREKWTKKKTGSCGCCKTFTICLEERKKEFELSMTMWWACNWTNKINGKKNATEYCGARARQTENINQIKMNTFNTSEKKLSKANILLKSGFLVEMTCLEIGYEHFT